jgi:hypothetical protein
MFGLCKVEMSAFFLGVGGPIKEERIALSLKERERLKVLQVEPGHLRQIDAARRLRLERSAGAAFARLTRMISGELSVIPAQSLFRGASIENLDLRIKRRGNVEPRNVCPLEVSVEKTVHAVRRHGKLATSVDSNKS